MFDGFRNCLEINGWKANKSRVLWFYVSRICCDELPDTLEITFNRWPSRIMQLAIMRVCVTWRNRPIFRANEKLTRDDRNFVGCIFRGARAPLYCYFRFHGNDGYVQLQRFKGIQLLPFRTCRAAMRTNVPPLGIAISSALIE